MTGRTGLRHSLQATALGLLLVAPVAGAHERSSGRGSCIQSIQQAKVACIGGCVDTARSEFVACFGSGSGCAQTCLTARLSCEAGPLQTIHECVGDPKKPNSCRAKFKADAAACKSDPNPSACIDVAQLNALKCRQACVDAEALNIQTCQEAFQMCLHGCPGSPSGAFLDDPSAF